MVSIYQVFQGRTVMMLLASFLLLNIAMHVDVTLTRTSHLSIPADHIHPLMETVFLSHSWASAGVWGVDLSSIFPKSQSNWTSVGQRSPIHGGSTHNVQDLNDLLLISWCQIPQNTFRGPVESWWVTAFFEYKGKQHDQAGNNVMPDWYICASRRGGWIYSFSAPN